LVCPLVPYTLLAQEANQPAKPPLALTRREALARPLLLHAESASAAFDSTSRAIILYRVAGAWLPLDRTRSVQMYRQAFVASRESSLTVRQYIQDEIEDDLVLISPSDALDLVPSAEAPIQPRLFSAIVAYYFFKADYPAATHAFEVAIANGVFPDRAAAILAASLPANASAERLRVLKVAVEYYRSHPTHDDFHWRLANLVARFCAQLPRELVLQATDIVLGDAEQQDKEHPAGSAVTMSFGENKMSFLSDYDFQFFAVAPALQHFDATRAAELLAQHPQVAASLKHYPDGLLSLDTRGSSLQDDWIRPNTNVFRLNLYNRAEEAQNLSPADMGLEFTIPRNLNILGVTGLGFGFAYASPTSPEGAVLNSKERCPSDVMHRLELARAVPLTRKIAVTCGGFNGDSCTYADTFPRASVFEDFAVNCEELDNGAAARAALQAELEVLGQVPEKQRVQYLAAAADTYLRLGDREAATKVVETGFAAARALYDQEASLRALRDFPKGVWGAAEAYREMTTLGVNASLDATEKWIDDIPDPQLRELERVMIARALVGVPVRRYFTAADGGGFYVQEVEATFDRLL
jgi:hypothetical protein